VLYDTAGMPASPARKTIPRRPRVGNSNLFGRQRDSLYKTQLSEPRRQMATATSGDGVDVSGFQIQRKGNPPNLCSGRETGGVPSQLPVE
jgi:hypothetical protein